MQYTDFQVAQEQLSDLLNKKLMGEPQSASLERRAQRLVDNWWARKNRPQVVVGKSGLLIVGCELGFGLGTIQVKRWITRFQVDQHSVHKLSPDAIALGYVNGHQLFITKVKGAVSLVSRQGAQVQTWTPVGAEPIPPTDTPLRLALDRAKMLGYLDYLKGQ